MKKYFQKKIVRCVVLLTGCFSFLSHSLAPYHSLENTQDLIEMEFNKSHGSSAHSSQPLSKKEILEGLKSGQIAVSQVVSIDENSPCAMTADDSLVPDFAPSAPKGFQSTVSIDLPPCGDEERYKTAFRAQTFVPEGEQMALLNAVGVGCVIGGVGAYGMHKAQHHFVKEHADIAKAVWEVISKVKKDGTGMAETSKNWYDEQQSKTTKGIAVGGLVFFGVVGAFVVLGLALRSLAIAMGTAVGGAGYLVCGSTTAYALEYTEAN